MIIDFTKDIKNPFGLKPCPFCGANAEMKVEPHIPASRGYDYTPRCTETGCCGRSAKKYNNEEQAIYRWNRRTDEQERPKGRWVEFPHHAYCIMDGKVYKGWVQKVEYAVARKPIFEVRYDDKSLEYHRGYVGLTVFLTQEEAEKELADMREEKLTLDSVITGLEEMLNNVDKLIKDIDKTSDMMKNFGADMRESE